MNMQGRIAALALGAALFANGARPAASAPLTPISLNSCEMALNGQLSASAAFVSARFVNDTNQVATAIDFTVWWGDGTSSRVHDVGTFSPGVAITHHWNVPLGIREIRPRLWDDVRVGIERITYDDQTQWLSSYAHLSEDAAYAQVRPGALRCRLLYG